MSYPCEHGFGEHGHNYQVVGLLAAELPHDCLFTQLQYERHAKASGRSGGGERYLETLEMEWLARNVCSRCHADLDEARASVTQMEAELTVLRERLDLIQELIDTMEAGPAGPVIRQVLKGSDDPRV
jgi:hypothetical protein